MAEAPASTAFSAPRTVMMPLRIKGFRAYSATSRSSATVLLPAGGIRLRRKGRPAASMSMAMAMGSAVRASSSFCIRVSRSQGFTVGTPQPCWARMACVAPSITAGSTPSPVKATMPALAQAASSSRL